jgi:Fur family transcriptional regulator, zinc uptake regulator
MDPIGFEKHDHSACRWSNITCVEDRCRAEGLQLTPVRRRVLEMLLEEHRALGAYEILDRLRAEGHGSQPPVAYRALDFLVKNGFAHKIEKLNAFIACTHPSTDHSAAFLICRVCSSVAEALTKPAKGNLGLAAKEAGFLIEHTVTEAQGICPNCQKASAE